MTRRLLTGARFSDTFDDRSVMGDVGCLDQARYRGSRSGPGWPCTPQAEIGQSLDSNRPWPQGRRHPDTRGEDSVRWTGSKVDELTSTYAVFSGRWSTS